MVHFQDGVDGVGLRLVKTSYLSRMNSRDDDEEKRRSLNKKLEEGRKEQKGKKKKKKKENVLLSMLICTHIFTYVDQSTFFLDQVK